MISYHTCPLASQEGKESGGMNVYVLEIGKELASQGIQVDVFTRSQEVENAPIVEVVPGFRVIHIIAGPRSHISKKSVLPYVDAFAVSVHEYYAKIGEIPDGIHAHYYLSGLIGKRLQSMFSQHVPMVLSFHTLSLMKNLVARDESEKEDSSRIEAEMELCKSSDYIIATSQSDKQYLEYLYDAPASLVGVVPPGVNPEIFHPVSTDDAKDYIHADRKTHMLLFVGRIEPLKGIDMIMYAMKIVKKRNPDLPVSLCIVGGDISQPLPSWSNTLQSLNSIRDVLHLHAEVNFVGKKTQEELLYYYNAADVVVMPSHYESFGMAALEAMSCGTPVITTNAAGISSIIDDEHGKLITSVNNPLLLAEQIEFLLKSREIREAVGQSLRKNVSDLSWCQVATRVIAIYDTIGV